MLNRHFQSIRVHHLLGLVIALLLHLYALRMLMLSVPPRPRPVIEVVSYVQLLKQNAPSSDSSRSPIQLKFKEPMPIVWRPQVDRDEVIVVKAPRPMVIVGSRLDPDFPPDFPESAYPVESREADEEGSVVLSIQILEDGRVGDVVLDKNSGYRALDTAAIGYVKRHWRFIPALCDGVPIVDWKTVSIDFQLRKVIVAWIEKP